MVLSAIREGLTNIMVTRTKAKATASKVATNAAARKSTNAKLQSKAKAPSKADQERKATKAQMAKAKRMMQRSTSQLALFNKAAKLWGDGNTALLAVAMHLNAQFFERGKKLGFLHFYGLTGDACKTAEQKAFLADVTRSLEELKAVFHQAWLEGKGGDSNTNRVVTNVSKEAYKAIYGALPRKIVYDIWDGVTKAATSAYRKSLSIKHPEDDQLETARLIAAFLTHRGIDIGKINQSVG